jgi:hypothetical protein
MAASRCGVSEIQLSNHFRISTGHAPFGPEQYTTKSARLARSAAILARLGSRRFAEKQDCHSSSRSGNWCSNTAANRHRQANAPSSSCTIRIRSGPGNASLSDEGLTCRLVFMIVQFEVSALPA